MQDPQNENDEAARRAEEEMERMLLAQEAAADEEDDAAAAEAEEEHLLMAPEDEFQQQRNASINKPKFKLSYTTVSFSAAAILLWYALRTRSQWYLALVFLGSSKYAYLILGNAIICTCILTFRCLTTFFLGGLRLVESEGLGDFFRWNITDTCLALTMFRSEVTVQSGLYFLALVLSKCLHWVVQTREAHWRMTHDAITVVPPGRLFQGWPTFASGQSSLGLLGLLYLLLVADVVAVVFCIQNVATHGPSVQLLFGFEAAILLVTALSLIILWSLHVLDGYLHYLHDTWHVTSLLHSWKDRKATLIFAMEVQAQGAKFLFYVAFFCIVFTYYGLPINLFREVYVSFQQVRARMLAFLKYRQLVQSMNRFPAPKEEDLQDDACIICRDEMTCQSAKQLPTCGHIFHTSCLREWLVQQQTCPTCRGDIRVMEAAAARQATAAEEDGDDDIGAPADENVAAADAARQEALTMAEREQQQQLDGVAAQPRDSSTAAEGEVDGELKRQIDAMKALLPSGKVHGTARTATITAPVQATAPAPVASPSQVFPALYKVIAPQGSPVYSNIDSNSSNNDTTTTKIERTLPQGVAILCLEMELQTCQDELGLMMRIPNDQWVWENQLEYIASVPRQ
mmetsp:Transcript_448/g.708  ORF Transcript_448/g.708 Transcript_448/m.708 type:complete len:627 (+) Transcript_448:196-2076(+)|eukprot:CAMPEP_0119028430 /NCGR_PEP_ID=MMETSP1176-20130426/38866_1 /TAXON_ID=265551 /ORGANISM="Synedropsis recta cf, Strain CCMP1620" /LENGTH=626 /DNA_ID=CAMNT_0006984557 /DNA_START=156 /DNA_END=2036 /DNA_ORIENTATION=-